MSVPQVMGTVILHSTIEAILQAACHTNARRLGDMVRAHHCAEWDFFTAVLICSLFSNHVVIFLLTPTNSSCSLSISLPGCGQLYLEWEGHNGNFSSTVFFGGEVSWRNWISGKGDVEAESIVQYEVCIHTQRLGARFIHGVTPLTIRGLQLALIWSQVLHLREVWWKKDINTLMNDIEESYPCYSFRSTGPQ